MLNEIMKSSKITHFRCSAKVGHGLARENIIKAFN